MATPTPDKGTNHANNLYECSNTHQLIHYYYGSLNYPIPSSLFQAIGRGYLKGWRGLTSQCTRRHITGSPESSMGHMDQVRKGTHSMQPQIPTNTTIPMPALPPRPNCHIVNYMGNTPQEPHNTRTHLVFMYAHAINGTTSSDQTGQFPITSNRGKAYVVVFYVFDANYICLVPIKNWSKEELLHAYPVTYE